MIGMMMMMRLLVKRLNSLSREASLAPLPNFTHIIGSIGIEFVAINERMVKLPNDEDRLG